MAGLYRDRGVVLRSIKLGETDRIVTFLTEGRGKVRAVAKGVRKPKSRFGARLEPTTHLNLQLYEGRNLDVVTQVETIDSNRKLRESYPAFTQAIAMLEAVDHVAQEAEANVPLYRMLAAALRTLAEDPVPAVSAAFFWKLLALEGVSPVLDACVRCDETVVDVAATFDVAEGGVLCRAGSAGRVGGGACAGRANSRWGPARGSGRIPGPGSDRGGVARTAGSGAPPRTAPAKYADADG